MKVRVACFFSNCVICFSECQFTKKKSGFELDENCMKLQVMCFIEKNMCVICLSNADIRTKTTRIQLLNGYERKKAWLGSLNQFL